MSDYAEILRPPKRAQNDTVFSLFRVTIQPLHMKRYFVYIMTNRSGTLYTGVTNNLTRRVLEHKRKLLAGFSSK